MRNLAEVDKVSVSLQEKDMRPFGSDVRPSLRILALFETATISGPAKNLFQFCQAARTLTSGPSVDLEIITFERSLGHGRGVEFVEAAKQLNLPLHCIPEKFLGDVRILSHLRRLSERLKPDLIETHAVKSHALLRASGLWRKTPWIAFHHGYTNTSLRSPLYNSFDRWSLRVAARVVTMNRGFAQQLTMSGVPAERITVLHNAVRLPASLSGRDEIEARRLAKSDLGISRRKGDPVCGPPVSRKGTH